MLVSSLSVSNNKETTVADHTLAQISWGNNAIESETSLCSPISLGSKKCLGARILPCHNARSILNDATNSANDKGIAGARTDKVVQEHHSGYRIESPQLKDPFHATMETRCGQGSKR